MADLHTVAAARLRGIGQRYTTGRRELVGALEAAGRPVSIPDVLADRPGLAQSSAYRNLAILEQADVVRRILGNGEFVRFELAEDLTEHHHHLICQACGAVDDFTVAAAVERRLRAALETVATSHGFTASAHRLDLVGTCRRCA